MIRTMELDLMEVEVINQISETLGGLVVGAGNITELITSTEVHSPEDKRRMRQGQDQFTDELPRPLECRLLGLWPLVSLLGELCFVALSWHCCARRAAFA